MSAHAQPLNLVAPSPARATPPPRRWLAIGIALVAAAAFPTLAAATGNEFYVGFASRIMIFVMAVSSLNLLVGYAGLVSFGHAAYFGLGAYAIAMVTIWGGSVFPAWIRTIWFAWPFAVACGALLALLVGLVALRTKQVYFIMITLAFSQMVYYLAMGMATFGSDNGMSLPGRSPTGLKGFDLAQDDTFYYTVLALLLVVLLALRAIIRSRFGVIVQAIAVNEPRMAAIGYPVFRYKLVAFVIAGAIAGLAGALLANQNAYVSPSLLDWTKSGLMLVMLILGGAGYLLGGVYGAAALLILEEVLAGHTQYWQSVVGVCIVAVVLVGNNGIAGLIHRAPKGPQP